MMKWLVNSGWWLGNRHSPLRRGISFVFSLSSLVLITACTDYVSQIEDRYGEWNVGQVYVPAEESSSSVAFPMSSWSGGGAGAIGSITDSRDGQSYKTVVIGTQTWMAQNLNYETANSYCYGDSPSNCTKYGRFYTWAAAMDSVGTWSTNGKGCGYNKTCSPTYPVRGVCPEGWHLPTQTEWNTLFTAVGGQSTAGNMLKSTNGWYRSGNGTDAYSFSALPAGVRYLNEFYNDEGNYAYFWSSTESNSSRAYNVGLRYGDDGADLYDDLKNNGFSVRCVKDDVLKGISSSSVELKSSSSNKNVATSSSNGAVKSSSSVKLSSVTDSRDGQSYKTVSIGTQTWMAQNLNYETANSYCYGDTPSNCTKYGRLYTWAAAKTACPTGWHLPTKAEFETLFTAVGGPSRAGKMLKSTSGWISSGNGTDDYSFSALPAGYRSSNENCGDEGNFAYFWSSTEYYSNNAYDVNLGYTYDSAYLDVILKNIGFSVRCVKD